MLITRSRVIRIDVNRSALGWIALRSARHDDALKELARKVPKVRLAATRQRANTITAGYWPKWEEATQPVIVVYLLGQDVASGSFFYKAKKTVTDLATIKEMARMRRFHQYR